MSSFHGEVDYFRQHVWMCNGICNQLPPFYGMVKRSMNRNPSPSDYWWNNHASLCNGTFIKISEPSTLKKASKDVQKNNRNRNISFKSFHSQQKMEKSEMSSNTNSHFTSTPRTLKDTPKAAYALKKQQKLDYVIKQDEEKYFVITESVEDNSSKPIQYIVLD